MKMLKSIILSALFPCILITSSCTRYYYTPTKQNVIVFKEKNDLHLETAIDEDNGLSLSVGYAFFENIGINTDFKTFDNGSEFDDEELDRWPSDFLWDNELILFQELAPDLQMALNLGHGFGAIGRNDPLMDLRLNRLYFQPSLGFSNDFVDIAFSARFTRLNYNIKYADPNHYQNLVRNYEFGAIGQEPYYFIEPALTLGVGYKIFKARVQFTRALKQNDDELRYINDNNIIMANFIFNIPANFTFKSIFRGNHYE